eukprot:5892279-Pleurochrysis_carterae.AAC.2
MHVRDARCELAPVYRELDTMCWKHRRADGGFPLTSSKYHDHCQYDLKHRRFEPRTAVAAMLMMEPTVMRRRIVAQASARSMSQREGS